MIRVFFPACRTFGAVVRPKGICSAMCVRSVHHMIDLTPPDLHEDVEFPPKDLYSTTPNRLRIMAKVPPPPPNMKPPFMSKGFDLMRGPEEVHNTLLHKQLGIVALQGGRLKYPHFEMMRHTINKLLDTKRMFAIWRVDAPWMSVTKKSPGSRMGGGRGNIHHFVTPVKPGRIILEVGGVFNEAEIIEKLNNVALRLPVWAKAVSHQMMEDEKMEEKRQEELNANPFTMKYIIQNNMQGCNKWTSPYDYVWFGKYR
ncbi:39S ribosomal protein L16, mitochondrial-like [Paramacrobiotus metropolitanus]|uniref:39S ribosomal protein L16, mitochondrial-like n=1 Tax=Paramacrobiotus metropolitanus TaxID=2943436 RepID=UPI00244631F5|nr:39S ribosomal protein L16, mitochondrial-like [Paramacrobiotus metropolitanus]